MKKTAITLCLLLTACATPVPTTFYKNVPKDEEWRDRSACQLEAQKIQSASFEYRGTFMEGAMIKKDQDQAFTLCMESKGYSHN